MKDYSHIKQGMYVLSSDIKDEDTYIKVRDAFLAAGARNKGFYCNRGFHVFMRNVTQKWYGWDTTGDLYDWHCSTQFGSDHKQVSIDFILNGPTKEEPTLEDHITAIESMGYKVEVEKIVPKWTNANLKVGDKVMLSKDTRWNTNVSCNPFGVIGEVDYLDLIPPKVGVKWGNGFHNSYNLQDSDLVPVADSYSLSETD